MKIKQLSLFLRNEKGQLNASCKVLANAQINIVSLSVRANPDPDDQDWGIARLIVEDWQCAKRVLEEKGFDVEVNDVVAVTVKDCPGGICELLDIIEKVGVNIVDMYDSSFSHRQEIVLVFRFDAPDRAIQALQAAGRNVLSAVSLFPRKIQQISLFLENKPGHLNAICRTLAEAEINIVTLSLADTQQFGIVRLIVEDWRRAKEVLEKAGYVVNVREVVAVTVADRPGGMTELLDIIGAAGVNIEYMYAFTSRYGQEAVLIFRLDEPDRAVAALNAAGRSVLDAVALFSNKK